MNKYSNEPLCDTIINECIYMFFFMAITIFELLN